MKRKETDPVDLQRIAPTLAAISKGNPFSLPENYFAELDQAVMQALQASQMAVENTEPVQSYSVPRGYFEELPLQIQERISEAKPAKSRPLLLRPVFSLSLAAACIAILLVTRPSLWFDTQLNSGTNVVTPDELSRYDHLSELDEHVLIDALEAKEQSSPESIDPDTDLENYLIENGIDLNELSNEIL